MRSRIAAMLAVCLMPTGPLRAEASDPVEAAAEAEDLAPVLEPIGSGIASYYGRELAGARTASGQRFDPAGYTAAHRTLPFGTQVQVTNAATGDSVVVTINDRGPFRSNRVLDMSEAAARRIGLIRAGHGTVRLAVVHPAG